MITRTEKKQKKGKNEMDITYEQLKEILEKHKIWLKGDEGGTRANLIGANLTCADLSDANLTCANLIGADLSGADLSGASLSGADLSGASLSGASLTCANLTCADLSDANLTCADLTCADLSRADLRDANLSRADLSGASLDYSAWPLWCGSLTAEVDDQLAVQLLYHTLSIVKHSENVSEDLKKGLLTQKNLRIALGFHRAGECKKIDMEDAEDGN